MSETPFQQDFYPITRRDDLSVDLAGWMPTALSSLPRWQALLQAWAVEYQAVEDVMFSLVVDTTISNATGIMLERLGAYVGEQRLGLEDGVYRRFIGARIAVNHSDGGRDTLASILRQLAGVDDVVLTDRYPAAILGVAVVPSFFDADLARRIGRTASEAVAGGVGSDWIAAKSGGFTFAELGALGPGAFSGSPLAQVMA